MAIPFVKMHGLGNDFILIDDLGKPAGLCQRMDAELARAMCNRRLGIGADQVLWLRGAGVAPGSDPRADARMDILNSDGSVAEMCGNGIRAAALYIYRHGPKRKPEYDIETLAGIKRVQVRDGLVRVDMGAPGLGASFGAGATLGVDVGSGAGTGSGARHVTSAGPAEGETLTVLGRELRFFDVNMGNPHAVFFVDDVERSDLEQLGPLIEVHPRFAERTNVEFVEVQGAREIKVRVWERGAGITLACGTGACASAVAALGTGRVQGTVEVRLPGGILSVQWDGGRASVFMEGPAEEVARGQYLVSR